MKHQHGCSCEHSAVRFCKHCNMVYCLGCNMEWGIQNYWYYPKTYPWYTTTGIYNDNTILCKGLGQNGTNTLPNKPQLTTTLAAGVEAFSACNHQHE